MHQHANATAGRSTTATASPSATTHALPQRGVYNYDDLKILLAGGAAGAVSKTVTAPLARLTILFQVDGLGNNTKSLTTALRHVIASEGVRSLWKGNGVTIIHRLPYSAINFWAYERLTEQLTTRLAEWGAPEGPGPHDVARRLVAGGCAGMFACASAYPLDLVRTRLAAQTTRRYYGGIVDCLRRIVADEGVLGLYRGLGATLVQVGPSLAINYCTYETLRNFAVEEGRPPSVRARSNIVKRCGQCMQ